MLFLPALAGSVLSSVAGGLVGKMFGDDEESNPQQIQNQTTSQLTPSPEGRQVYNWLANQGMNTLNTPIPYYPFQTFVSPSSTTQLAHRMGIAGVGAMDPYLQQAAGNYGFLSTAADVANNPYVNNMMMANQGLTLDTLFNKVLPNIQTSYNAASAAGRNSPRLGMLQGQAVADAMTGLARTNAQTQLAAYNSGLGAQQTALGQTGAMLGNQLMPYQGMLGVGKDIEGYTAGALNDRMQRFMWPYTEPYQRLQLGQGLLGAFAPYGQQTGQSQYPNPNYMNPYQAMLGGASAGLGLYNQLFPQNPTATPAQMNFANSAYTNQVQPLQQGMSWGYGAYNTPSTSWTNPGGGLWGSNSMWSH